MCIFLKAFLTQKISESFDTRREQFFPGDLQELVCWCVCERPRAREQTQTYKHTYLNSTYLKLKKSTHKRILKSLIKKLILVFFSVFLWLVIYLSLFFFLFFF